MNNKTESSTTNGETPLTLPPRPVEPVPGECCGGNCVNCVWVYYERALKRWEERCAQLGVCANEESGSGPACTERSD